MLAHPPRLRSAAPASWSDESGLDEKEISIEKKFLWNFFRGEDSCDALQCGNGPGVEIEEAGLMLSA
jgi:hypothetical protein